MFKLFAALLILNLSSGVLAARAKNDCHLKNMDTCLEQVEKISNDPNSQELLKTKDGVKKICGWVGRASDFSTLSTATVSCELQFSLAFHRASLGTSSCMEENFKKVTVRYFNFLCFNCFRPMSILHTFRSFGLNFDLHLLSSQFQVRHTDSQRVVQVLQRSVHEFNERVLWFGCWNHKIHCTFDLFGG